MSLIAFLCCQYRFGVCNAPYWTGVDIAYENMENDHPEEYTAGPTENSDDENVDLDADEDLPWPNPKLQ